MPNVYKSISLGTGMLEDYLDVKTGQDLIDKGVVPKDFPSHLALITYLRLKKIRDTILAGINDDMLGKWLPINDTTIPLIEGPKLAKYAVADDKLGHRVKFKEAYDGKMKDGYNTIQIALPKGTLATLTEYAPKDGKISFRVDNNIPGQGNRKNFTVTLDSVVNSVEVSSLGQLEPQDKEEEVMKNTLLQFFPKTVLDTETARDIIMGILMGKSMILYGDPGAGKSEAVKDIISIAKQREIVFHVKDCQVQCSPFSLFDETFAKTVPACPECKIRYDKDFKETGHFKPPAPKDVKVVVAAFTDGKGIEFMEGTTGIMRMHLAGFKLPNFENAPSSGKRESEYDPEGYHPGVFPRTNNGLLNFEEMDKLRPQTQDECLEPLNSKRIKPDQLRFSYPAFALIVGTANDNTKFSEALNDRMLLLGVYYPDDVDVSHTITRRAYHGEWTPAAKVEIGDTQTKEPLRLRESPDVPMPVTIERAVDALYLKFRGEYTGKGRNKVSGSNRSKLDSLAAARAELLIDQLFFDDTPEIATAQYAIKGIQFALYARIQEPQRGAELEGHKEMDTWVENEFPDVLKKEEDVWWCRLYKEIAIKKTQIPTIEGNFIAELEKYDKDPKSAVMSFDRVRRAYELGTAAPAQLARVDYPFMDHLFKEQSGFARASDDQVVELVTYFMKSRANTSCTIGSTK